MNLIKLSSFTFKSYFITFLGICLLLVASVAICAKKTVIGQAYPIIEEDVLKFIQSRLNSMKQEGELEKLKNEMLNVAKQQIDRPKSVKLKTTEKYRSWKYDPSFQVPYDLRDHKGTLIAKKGEIFNPLHTVSLKNTLIFFDADNQKQVEFVKRKIKIYESKVKLILINGSIIQANKLFQLPIYFDQQGLLIKKFSIRHVPAIVVQNGLKLKIMEITP